jgi:hypothetical protein
MRSLTDPVILSTVPHILAIIPPLFEPTPLSLAYAALITSSTLLSILWHLYKEPSGPLFILDYGIATVWTTFDLALGFKNPVVILLNGICIGSNIYLEKYYRGSYERWHSWWHLLNVGKSMLVSSLLFIPAA